MLGAEMEMSGGEWQVPLQEGRKETGWGGAGITGPRLVYAVTHTHAHACSLLW